MQAVITPSTLSGTVTPPASKSVMQRACAAALIRGGNTILKNAGVSADDKAAINIIQQLGANVTAEGNAIKVWSKGISPVSNEINCRESGLSVRMFTSIAAITNKEIKIIGEGSLGKRPLSFFDQVFPALNVECTSKNGFLPLTIKGPLQPANISVDGALSSQFLTGLLFAYSAAEAQDVLISVDKLNSKPYIDLTLEIMREFNLKTPENNNYESFYFDKQFGSVHLNKSDERHISDKAFEYTIESDWSNTAFLLVAGAIAGNIIVKGIKMNSVQGDKDIVDVLQRAEANISMQNDSIGIKASKLKSFVFDATDCPDLFPPLVALAAHCSGVSKIKGVSRLLHKESNRALSLTEEFAKMNVSIIVEEDMMKVNGGNKISGAVISSHNDHRIAMACAVTALKATTKTQIKGAEAVNKSYPGFWKDLQTLGVGVSLTDN